MNAALLLRRVSICTFVSVSKYFCASKARECLLCATSTTTFVSYETALLQKKKMMYCRIQAFTQADAKEAVAAGRQQLMSS
jgi:hypothetical protein